MSVKPIRWRLLSCLATVVAASLLVGCSIPYSDHPLSDNKTSTVDDRLIGRWLQIDQDDEDEETTEEEKADEAGKSFDFITVGLRKSNSKTMVLVYVELDDDGELTVERAFFFTTTINKQHYLSYQQKDEEDILEDEERSIDSEPMTEEDRAFIADDSVDDEDAELELAQVLLAFRKGKYKD